MTRIAVDPARPVGWLDRKVFGGFVEYMRGKKGASREALTGQFRDHHDWLLAMMFERIDALSVQVEALTGRIEQELIAEIGVDMTRLPASGHLATQRVASVLARIAPGARQSAGKAKPGATGKGSPWVAGMLGEAVLGVGRTKTFLGSRYHRLARKRGKQRAIVATGRPILVIACQLLSDPMPRFTGLGPHWHDRIAPLRRKQQLIAELERLSGKRSPFRRPPPETCPPIPGSLALRRDTAACPGDRPI
ncbi:MAG: hypothetical protein WAK82_39940 [Streptosporangiaceae bacterium]